MSPLLSSQAVVLATAMAVSGSVILFALRRQRPFPVTHLAVRRNSASSAVKLRSCLASGEGKLWRRKKKKKVHFADHLVEAVEVIGSDDDDDDDTIEEEFEEEENPIFDPSQVNSSDSQAIGELPANRAALYNGILRDRLQRMACSY